jgi:hypothetical protein
MPGQHVHCCIRRAICGRTRSNASGDAVLPSTQVLPPVLTDAEVDDICAGLKQNAAKIRYFRDTLKMHVLRKPNGRPLVLRSDWERRAQPAPHGNHANRPRWRKEA